jgi:NADH dehydrogenase (ubiquinone) 1 alpha/beta subcomplex 1, acyl-carrier protein
MHTVRGEELEQEKTAMEADEIRTRIKQVISSIANIPPDEIPDAASYRTDLGLDSLSALEVVIGVEFEFKFKVPEYEAAEVETVDETVRLVERYLPVATG